MSPQKSKPVSRKGLIQITTVISTVVVLSYLLEVDSYLLFHSITEIFSTVILWSIFVLAFNTRRFLKTSYFIFLGTGFLFVGIFDTFHLLAYKGMNIFPGSNDGNLSTQLWIAMRYLLGFSFLFAPFFLRKKIGFRPLFVIFTMVTAVLLLAILWKPVFPACYIPGAGLTLFKKNSEYIICIILLASILLLNRNRTAFHADVFRYLVWSVSLTIAAELSFTLYKDIFGLFNTLGHILEVLAFLAAYKAIIEKTLSHPHDLIFFDMKRHEAALSESEKRYKSLFNSMTEGFALHEILCDDQGTPCDYRFLDVNPAFEQMTGLKRSAVLGRTHSEILPGDDPLLVKKYGAVALTGKSDRFENYSPALKRYYDVLAYCPAHRQFAVVSTDITERKRTEEALRESEERLRLAQESAAVGIWDWKVETGELDFTPELNQLYGLPPETIKTYQDWRDRVHPDDIGRIETARDEAIAIHEPFDLEFRGRHSSGEYRWISTKGGAIYDQVGRTIRVFGVNIDINDRKQAEEALRASERLYRAIGESIDYGIWVCDTQGRNTYASESFLKLVGITQEQCSDMGWGDVLHPDDVEATIVAWKECVQKGGPWYREHRYRGTDGQWHPVLACGVAVRDEQGKVTAWAGINLDISRMKLAEAALQESETRFRTMADSIPQLAWIAKADGLIYWYNNRWYEYTGTTPQQMEGWGWQSVHDPDMLPKVLERWKASIAMGDPFDMEFPLRGADGKFRMFLTRGMPFKDAKGRILQWFGTNTDISERIEASRRESEALAAASAARSAIDTVNAMDEGVVLIKIDGTILNANPSALAMTGLQLPEITGKNMKELLAKLLEGDDLDMAKRALIDIGKKRKPQLRTITMRPAGTRPFYISPAVSFIGFSQGFPETAVVTLKDITELHENTEILERVFDNSHISIVYLDAKFNFIRVNSTYAADCGHPEDFYPGKNHFAIYPHEENERIFRQVVASGNPYTVHDKPFEFPDHPEWGVSYWDWSLQPIKDEQGQVEALVFCLQNTTARKASQLAMEESERKYRELVENANSIIMRITPDHRITFFNEYAQTFFGYSAKEIIGRSVLGTIVPDVDSYGNDLGKMLESVTVDPELFAANENENICKNGKRVWISWTNKVLRDQNGIVKEILCVGKDATERKQVQDENLRYQERLRGLAEQLAASEELERWQISRYIHDTIVQNLSLSSMKLGGLQNSLTKAGLDEKASTLNDTRTLIADAIDECRNAMSELTPPLLYELGLVAALIDLANRLKERHGTPITIEGSGENDNLGHTLRGLLFQSARELIINALKHANCSCIRVSVGIIECGVQLVVQDDGRGFDAVTLYQHKAVRGGFGLFSVRERVQNLGGRLEIQSSPGRGTEIRIFMPVLEDEKQDAGSASRI